MSAFMFLVDGCPIAFGSASCPTDFSTMSCPDEDSLQDRLGNYIGGFPTVRGAANRPTIVAKMLALTGFSWDEDATNVLQADLKVSAPTIVLYDRPLIIDGVVRPRGTTYLASRKSTRGTVAIPNTQLTAALTRTATSFAIDAPSAFPGFPGAGLPNSVVYIDAEAIKCDSLIGSTLTVTSGTVGRGCYNSIASIHAVDVEPTYSPTVWWGFPGFDNRRVSLWRIDPAAGGTYVATRLWTGYCTDVERSGTGYQLNCTHAIITERARPVGATASATRLRGYNTNGSYLELSWPGGPAHGLTTAGGAYVPNPPGGRVVNTARELYDRIASAMRDQLTPIAATWPSTISLAGDGADGAARFYASVNSNDTVTGTLAIDGVRTTVTSTQTVNPRTVNAVGGPLPPVIVSVNGGDLGQTPVGSIAGLPLAWGGVPISDGDLRTTLTPVMRGRIDETHWAVVEPRSVVDNGAGSSTLNPGAFLIGPNRIETSVNERNPRNNSIKTHVPVVMTPQVLVTSRHWLLAMRRGFVEDSTFANSGADVRDWDWTSQSAILRATQSAFSGIQLYLDGAATIDGVFRERMKRTAASIGIRKGRLSPFVFRPPMPTDPIAATYISRQFVGKSAPFWRRLKGALVNVVEIDTGNGRKVTIRDQQSARRYGLGAPLSIKFPLDEIRGTVDLDPFVILGEVVSRLFGTFGNPCSLVSFALGASHMNDAAIGEYINLSDWISPNGDGTVGLQNTVGQLVQRSPQNIGGNGESYVTFTLLLYGRDGLAGFAPAIHAASLGTTTVARDTIVAAINYLGVDAGGVLLAGYTGPTDYAGSNTLGYRWIGAGTNDGGTSWIKVGGKHRLVERNTTTPHAPESVTVLSVNVATKTIVFTAGVSVDWVAIAAAGNLDIVPDTYALSGATQRQFAYVASQTAPYPIGGTADLAKVFS